MSSELAVIESGEELAVTSDLSGMTLTGLAEIANREHGLAIMAGLSFLDHAIKSGEALLAADASVPPGEWGAWVAREFIGHPSTAMKYMRFATYRKILSGKGVTSQRAAERQLRDLSLFRHRGGRSNESHLHQEALELVRAGYPKTQVAKLFGVSNSTIYDWLDQSGKRARTRLYKKRRRLAEAALLREEQNKAARKIGGDVGKAYELVYALSTVLDAAAMAEGNPDAKATLQSALLSLYVVRDKINKAIGTSTPVESK